MRISGLMLGLAVAGVAWVGLHMDATATPLGLALVLAAGLSWAAANLVGQAAGRVDMLGFMVWSSAFAAPVLGGLAWGFEGFAPLLQGAREAGFGGWSAVAWQAVGNTLFGYGVWGWLLARYPAATISPLSLLVPVFGMATSALVLHEPLSSWKLTAAALVLGGLAINTLWPMLMRPRMVVPAA